jgi:MFS family permease
MSVEHAPVNKRGFFGAYPQIGVPSGLILATGVMLAVTNSMTEEAFLAWGWRIPFLLSVILIGIGYIIRRSVNESPVFTELRERKKESAAPLKELFAHNWRQVVLTALIFIANNAAGYLLIAFFSSYATKPAEAGGLGMDRSPVLLASTVAAIFWLAATMFGGILSDRIGRIRTFQIGYAWLFVWAIPMFLLIDTKNIALFALALVVLAVGLGLSYGPQAALYAEMFPAHVRYSGVSIGYALGAILGGAFAPLIAQLLLDETSWSPSIGIYIMVLASISFAAVSVVKETRGVHLGVSARD